MQATDAGMIDYPAMYQTESTWDPFAHNKESDARGLGQITPIVRKEWDNFHPDMKFKDEQYFDPGVNMMVSQWYAGQRIPQMLKAEKLPVNEKNILWAYHDGIGNVVKGYMSDNFKTHLEKYLKNKENSANIPIGRTYAKPADQK
jgi:hypothetical protein